MKKSSRLQVNIAVDQAFLDAVEDIRAMTRPIPTITDVIKQAVRDRRDGMKARERKFEAKA